jgi:hypothetical protein
MHRVTVLCVLVCCLLLVCQASRVSVDLGNSVTKSVLFFDDGSIKKVQIPTEMEFCPEKCEDSSFNRSRMSLKVLNS